MKFRIMKCLVCKEEHYIPSKYDLQNSYYRVHCDNYMEYIDEVFLEEFGVDFINKTLGELIMSNASLMKFKLIADSLLSEEQKDQIKEYMESVED